jgi:pyrimidine operon attenuation protein/uracil phosphoribosyltransferase
VDDVLNSGKTMLYALTPFVRAKAPSIDILTLIDRSHKRFPVHANYIGISLSTMLQEHIEVTINKNKVVVNLV